MNDNGRKEYTTYLVKEIDLAYNIISEGHLDKLIRVSPNKFGEGYVYFFEKHDDVKRVMDEYNNSNR